MDFNKLTNSDKYHIAEFIFSYEADVLIKSDAEKVIEVFKRHEVEKAASVPLEANAIAMLIKSEISEADREIIMAEYYSGDLNG